MSAKSAKAERKELQTFFRDIFKKLCIDFTVDINNKDNLIQGMTLLFKKLIESERIPINGETDGEGEWQEVTRPGAKKEIEELRQQVRSNGDIADFATQRGMKGCFLINGIILPELEQGKGKTYEDQILAIIKQHYGVSIPANDLQACHPVGKNCAIVKIWNRREGSAYHKLVFAVKCGGKPRTKVADKEVKRDVNEERETESGMGGDLRREGESGDHQIEGREGDGERTDQQTQEVKTGQQTSTGKKIYINFQLTRKRYQMLGYIKGLKKMNKIFKFSSNENGDISIKATEKSPFVKLTFNQNDPNSYNYEKNDIERLLATL
jgi:hypothetical protein